MDLNGAKGILKSLADGVDPLTGEVLPEDHICNQPEIIRAIYMVLMELSRGKQHREKPENDGAPWSEEEAVSYTHLDVYKRQTICSKQPVFLIIQHFSW